MQNLAKNIVESLAEQTKSLNKQTEALISNTLGKDCKSNIYDKINSTNERLAKIEDSIYSKEDGRPGLQGQISIVCSELKTMQRTLFCLGEKTKQDMINALEPIIESIDEIKERNLKKDAISNWKLNFPAGILTILSITQIIIFFIKG